MANDAPARTALRLRPTRQPDYDPDRRARLNAACLRSSGREFVGEALRCMVSAGQGSDQLRGLPPWDHVSVSRADRCPWWDEMDHIARLFFRATETAMQLHVPASDHVNYHAHCLHLWRPTGLKRIPLPPSIMVGPDSAKGRRHA